LQTPITLRYQTNCDKVSLTHDSLGIGSKEMTSLRRTQTIQEYKSNAPLSAKVITLEVCDGGYLELNSFKIYYNSKIIEILKGYTEKLTCRFCAIYRDNSHIRIESNNANSNAVFLIRGEMSKTWKLLYYFARYAPYFLFFAVLVIMLCLLVDYSLLKRIKLFLGMILASLYFYLADNLRLNFESGPIGEEKIVGYSQYNNSPLYYDYLSFVLLLCVLLALFIFDPIKILGCRKINK
jgi:hypothetical protein